ncbi:hypothetical protein CBR_g18875 [Chara braunii]|uniref:Photosystem II 5 kDa protein, chloroplastic n=1 Tax=Chara braunii TaxID=69332 RepID=A0A388KWM9_CHABU|nr:hypothetical protein CBR_g18875 [Chara braunii]|eukprot:GBG74464.1 hypothetical protein CBR_g18875 [Chara braunii]
MASSLVAAATTTCALSSAASNALSGSRMTMNTSRQTTVPSTAKFVSVRCKAEEGSSSSSSEAMTRRGLVGAATLATLLSMTSTQRANAEDEPKKGSAEAKKKYRSICVTMPTASVCHN